MPRLFVPPENLQGQSATLGAAAHRHLVRVLRMAPGAELCVFDGRGTEIDARIIAVGKSSVEVALGARRRLLPAACSITLLISPPRGERMDFVVQKTTELGVACIVPVMSARGVVRAGSQHPQRWRAIAEAACEQCGRADVPVIEDPSELDAALSRTAAQHESRLLLWEEEHGRALYRSLSPSARTIALVVGPEGGFAPDEAARAVAAGFAPVSLGARILRSETAAMVAVALAQAATGGLD